MNWVTGLQSCKFIKRPKKKKVRSPNATLSPKMTISSPVVKGPRMSPTTTIGIASPKLSPVVGSVRRSNFTPDYAVVRWNNLAPEDCKTPEATRPHYSPKTRRRLRLTFDIAQPGDIGDEGEEFDKGPEVDFGKRKRST